MTHTDTCVFIYRLLFRSQHQKARHKTQKQGRHSGGWGSGILTSTFGSKKPVVSETTKFICGLIIVFFQEGLHVGCYATGVYLYGARWDSNEEGPVEVNPESHGSDEVVQHLGIVRCGH